jgi:hypothetical protein
VSPAAGLISTASSVDRWLEVVLSQLLRGREEQVRVFTAWRTSIGRRQRGEAARG